MTLNFRNSPHDRKRNDLPRSESGAIFESVRSSSEFPVPMFGEFDPIRLTITKS